MTTASEVVNDICQNAIRSLDPLLGGNWVDDMREIVERRLGVEAGDFAVLDDPAYIAVLNAHASIVNARQMLENSAGQIARAIDRVERSAR